MIFAYIYIVGAVLSFCYLAHDRMRCGMRVGDKPDIFVLSVLWPAVVLAILILIPIAWVME